MTSYESCQIQEGSSCELVFDTAVRLKFYICIRL